MEARNRNGVSLTSILLCISIVIIIVMAYYIYNLNNEVTNLKEELSKTNTTSENSSNSDKSDKKNNQNSDSKNTDIDSEIVGVWKTYDAIDSETGEIITTLSKVFGTSYLSFGSTLKLNENGTFLDSIYPITSSEVSVEGTYTVKKDLYKSGDCYIFLTYDDKTEKTLFITYENKVPILTSAFEGERYQFDLKK